MTTMLTVTSISLRVGGAVTEHTLTFNERSTITVNGEAVTSPYTFTSGDVIVINNNNDYISKYTINGTEYWDTTTVNLIDTDISIVGTHVSHYPVDFVIITINT